MRGINSALSVLKDLLETVGLEMLAVVGARTGAWSSSMAQVV